MSKFITVEGLDAAGKSSVIIPYLQSKLNAEKTLFVADMKTGKISQKVREIFMDPECITENTDWRTIAFLASVARSDMVYQDIIPALKAGKNVVCDRYVDTSFVYNLKSDTAPVNTILNLSTHLVYPNIIIFAYCSYEELVKRKGTRDDNDQWDIMNEESYNDKMEKLEENVSDYLDAIVLEWADENKLVIQDTTRTALAESFMADLTQLLEAYNIDIPQEKTDLYEASLETGQKLFDEYSVVKEENEQLKAELDSLNKFVVTESFISESPELSLVEAEKLRKVSKELTYESIDDFARKLSGISESYQSKRAPRHEIQPQSQDSLFEDFYGEPDYGFQEEIVESYEDTDSYKIDPLVAAIAGKI